MKINKKITFLFLALVILAVPLCSINEKILNEDDAAKKDITAAINNYSSDDWEIRLAAVKRAARYGDTVYAKNVILLLLLAADDYHPIIQIEAIKNLQRIKPLAAADTLRNIALNDTDANVRYAAISALQDYASPDNEEVFTSCTSSQDWLIRESGYIGLLRIVPYDVQKKHLGKIIRGINDDSISVRIAVLTNVKLRDPLIYNEIVKIINNKKSGLSLLKAALSAARGYRFDKDTRERIVKLLTHRNRDIRLLSLQALKQEKIDPSF